MKEIGGYFEFDLKNNDKYPYSDGFHFQSARSALYCFLKSENINEIYFPRYICNSMIKALDLLNITIKFYSLDDSLFPIISNYNNEYILYVNYFGICDYNVDDLLLKYPSNRLIIDNSQSFFSSPRINCAATIYSPRKFLPVPEGGTILTSKKLNYTGQGTTSINALSALVKRFEGHAQHGYGYFCKASDELNNISCKKISKLAYYLLNDIDYLSYLEIRRNNYIYLNSKLKNINVLNLNEDSSPLCYPLMFKNEVNSLKANLIDNGVYVPTYWSEAINRIEKYSIEYCFIKNTLFIPIDQRYGIKDMEIIVKLIKGIINEQQNLS
ncbi:TPA: hypothetical protein ACX6QM_003321 [Photobacterium damselae]